MQNTDLIAGVGKNDEIRFYDYKKKEMVKSITGLEASGWSVVVIPDTELIAVGL